MIELEEICTADPKTFYDRLRKLGPWREKSEIPWVVYGDSGDISCDHKTLLNKWKKEFEKLYQGNRDKNTYMKQASTSTKVSEMSMLDHLYDNDDRINTTVASAASVRPWAVV